jgi:hypothetical protein
VLQFVKILKNAVADAIRPHHRTASAGVESTHDHESERAGCSVL